MNKLKLIVRIVFGLMLVIFGLNKFLDFMPPLPLSDEANEFFMALVKSGYMMTVVAIVEIICGILLLVNKYQPLALLVIFPVLFNAILFHIFLAPASIGGAVFAVAMNVFLIVANKESYKLLLKA